MRRIFFGTLIVFVLLHGQNALAADGWYDMAVFRPASGSPAGEVWVYANNQLSHFGYDGDWGSISPTSSDLVLCGDFNGDGFADIARYRPSSGGAMYVYLNTGSKSFSYAGQWISGGVMSTSDVMLSGDWDHDGITDIAVYHPSAGYCDMFKCNGKGGFSWLGYWTLSGYRTTDKVITGDFNGDGFTDLLVTRNGNGIVGSPDEFDQAWLYINGLWHGVSGWEYAGQVINGNVWDNNDSLCSADVTGDGYADLVITRTGTADQIIVFENDHTGHFGSGTIWANQSIWNNGDVRLFGDFAGALPPPPKPQCGDAYHPYPVGDLNKDCYVDFRDLKVFADQWLASGCITPAWCNGADINHSGKVAFQDFSLLAESWLNCSDPKPSCNYNPAIAIPGGYNHDFSLGLAGWVVSNNAFIATHSNNGLLPWKGSYYLWSSEQYATSDQGTAVGVLRSANFYIATVDSMTFYIAGEDGIGAVPLGSNYVRLIRVSDGAILFEQLCPQTQSWQRIIWDTAPYVGTEVYLEIGDGNPSPTNGWIAVGDFEAGLDQVPSPWTAVTVGANTVSCWGRTYGWDALPFPSQVTTQGQSLLAGPIRLVASVGGQQVSWSPSGQQSAPALSSSSGAGAYLTRTVQGAGVNVTGKATVEFDGMIRVDFSLTPTSSPVQFDSLMIEVPFNPAIATLEYLYYEPFYGQRTAGAVGSFSDVFHPMIWLGNEKGGLFWFAESDKGWLPVDNSSAIKIIPGAQETVLQLRLWDVSHSLSGTETFTMGFQADPVKLLPSDWHSQRLGGGVWWYTDPNAQNARQVEWKEITYPGSGNFNDSAGTVEFWLKPLFDPRVPQQISNANRDIFHVDFDNGNYLNFQWNIQAALSASLYNASAGANYGFNTSTSWWDPNDWHLMALTWNNTEWGIWCDGAKIATWTHGGQGIFTGNATSMRLGQFCDFIADELRISNIYRTSYDTANPPSVDAYTLVLDRFDQNFRPDDVRCTSPAKITGSGGLVSNGVRFIPGKFGNAVQLLSSYGITPQQHYANVGTKVLLCGEDWAAVQNYPEPWCGTQRANRDSGQYCSCQDPNNDTYGDLVNNIHGYGLKVVPYFGFLIADIAPEWNDFKKTCLTEPNGGPGYQRQASGGVPDQNDWSVSYKSKYADFIIDGMKKVKEKYGVNGVYLDATSLPLKDTNQLHGSGYDSGGGVIKPTYDIFAYRSLLKRINAIFAQDGGVVEAHTQMCTNLPAVSFATCILDGEWFHSLGTRGQYILNYASLESHRAHFGQHWGVPTRLLDPTPNPWTDEELMSMTLLEDVFIQPSSAVAQQLEETMGYMDVLSNFGADSADWFGYWNNQSYVTSSDPNDIKTSFFRRSDNNTLLLIVSNLGYADIANASVTVNLTSLGLSNMTKATMWTYGLGSTPISVNGGTVSLGTLPKWTPRLILIVP